MHPVDRYHRQTLLPQLGRAGQAKLRAARVLLIGCGALGTVIAEQLVRAGVGFIRICDRDLVELTNLQRQVLFDESDAHNGVPKAVAAKRRLLAINSSVEVDARVVDVHSGNVEALAGCEPSARAAGAVVGDLGSALTLPSPEVPVEGKKGRGERDSLVDLILDGTDNIETRYLLNDLAVKRGIAWVYGACVGTEGRVMAVVPGKGACLRCLFEEPAGAGELATCDTAGVLAPAASVVASLQVTMALKMLLGESVQEVGKLVTVDLWNMRFKTMSAVEARREDCPCCGRRAFPFLDRRDQQGAVALCGRGAVQVRPAKPGAVDLAKLAERWDLVGETVQTDYYLKLRLREGQELTLFPDGRALVAGTSDLALARSLYARFIGS
ncbi:MAG TPA: ThiF family adenylyltransferase [Tepidisphaeraceae bacterium]|jgi:adenylyltransferase/sulfurtransferase